MRMVIGSLILAPFLVLWRALPWVIKEHTAMGKGLTIWLLLSHFGAWIWNGAVLQYPEKFTKEGSELPYRWTLGWEVFFLGIGITLGFIGLLYLGESLKERYKSHKGKHPPKENETVGLIKDFIDAKHSKICPEIEFKD